MNPAPISYFDLRCTNMRMPEGKDYIILFDGDRDRHIFKEDVVEVFKSGELLFGGEIITVRIRTLP